MIYEDEPFPDRIDHVADLGFDTVEFWTWVEKDLDAIERRLDENDLSLAGMAATKDQAAPQELTRALTDPTTQESAVADIKESIEVATRLDCLTLIILVGPETDHAYEESYESIVEGLQEVAPMAENAGVSLVLEPLNTAVDHPGYFLEESVVGYEIVREVDSSAVKVLFDIYHQQITEGNIISNIRDNVERIGHIHAADVPGRHEPGTGELNYPNVFAAVDDTDYDGYVGFEFSPEDDSERALERIAEVTR
jgi:hydroxypyruvate isomerase